MLLRFIKKIISNYRNKKQRTVQELIDRHNYLQLKVEVMRSKKERSDRELRDFKIEMTYDEKEKENYNIELQNFITDGK